MLPGLESESIGSNKELLKNLIEKFRTQLAQFLYEDMNESQSLEIIRHKIGFAIRFDNFYAFKIFPG